MVKPSFLNVSPSMPHNEAHSPFFVWRFFNPPVRRLADNCGFLFPGQERAGNRRLTASQPTQPSSAFFKSNLHASVYVLGLSVKYVCVMCTLCWPIFQNAVFPWNVSGFFLCTKWVACFPRIAHPYFFDRFGFGSFSKLRDNVRVCELKGSSRRRSLFPPSSSRITYKMRWSFGRSRRTVNF